MKTILFLNSIQQQCGVFQYGKRVAHILGMSENYEVQYCEITSMAEYHNRIMKYDPAGIIMNFHPLTMNWFTGCSAKPGIKHYCIHHEGSEHTNLGFQYYLYADSTFRDAGNRYSLPRPLFNDLFFSYQPKSVTVPVFTSFGFGFGNKGFGRVVKTVNDQFDEAIVRLHIPRAYYGDREGQASKGVFPGCYAEVKKPGIKLEITTDFKDDFQLLQFLCESTLNIFLYDDMPGRGLSSVIDYALSVPVPLAINHTQMFRHIYDAYPPICVEDATLPQIIERGWPYLNNYRERWSYKAMVDKFEQIFNSTL